MFLGVFMFKKIICISLCFSGMMFSSEQKSTALCSIFSNRNQTSQQGDQEQRVEKYNNAIIPRWLLQAKNDDVVQDPSSTDFEEEGSEKHLGLIAQYRKSIEEVIAVGEYIEKSAALARAQLKEADFIQNEEKAQSEFQPKVQLDRAYISVTGFVFNRSKSFVSINREIQVTLKNHELTKEQSLLEWSKLKAKADKNLTTITALLPDIEYLKYHDALN